MSEIKIVIKPFTKTRLVDLKEIWSYKDLLYIFVWRDIKVRYKQTFFGIAWGIMQPLASMIIFTIFFGNLAKIPSGSLPYSLFVLCGLVFWTFFANSLSHAANCMVENEGMIKKVYFPKMILPISSVITSGVDFIINLVILLVFAIISGFIPSPTLILIIPISFIVTSVTSIGLGLFLASLNVKYRDVRYILPFFIQFLMFLTPIIYSLDIVAPRNRILMAINPVTSVVESVRSGFSNSPLIDTKLIVISLISAVIILFIGLWYFRRTESYFADIV